MTPLVQPEASARVLAVVGFRCLADGQPENLIYRPGATAPEFLASAANGWFPRNRRSAYDFSLGFTRFRCRSGLCLLRVYVLETDRINRHRQGHPGVSDDRHLRLTAHTITSPKIRTPSNL